MPVADTDAARRAEISHLADALNERLIAIRRDIHAHPEIGHHEHRTTALIVDELERVGLVAKVLPIGTGAYCDVLPVCLDCVPTSTPFPSPTARTSTTPRGTLESATRAATTCTPRYSSASASCCLGFGTLTCSPEGCG